MMIIIIIIIIMSMDMSMMSMSMSMSMRYCLLLLTCRHLILLAARLTRSNSGLVIPSLNNIKKVNTSRRVALG
jgi:hypothetical protein